MANNFRRDPVTSLILGLVGLPGLPARAFIAPRVLDELGLSATNKWWHQRKYYVNRTIERLARRGLIKFVENNQGIKCARLTTKGQAELQRYRLKELQIPKPRRWDGKYRLVIFDIKEWKRGVRNEVRRWLEHLGFVRLQQSVWVYPYECQEVVVLLKSHFKIGQELLYLTVESIENDRWLKREFGLL